jgi:LL-diaminopimelate aminotransferase
MIKINENFLKLQAGYLFPEISRRVSQFADNNPNANIIKLGIGDVTEPLAPAVIEAMHIAVDEMSNKETFHGYGPEQGYAFLTDAIIENDFLSRGININPGEIFISDGSKCDTGNFQEVFGIDNTIAVTDPVYPVYVDTNVMAGRTGDPIEGGAYEGIVYMPCNAENNFIPALPKVPVDLIYLCYPNNPTGAVATKKELAKWVDYARENKAIILFDAAYEAYIADPDIPHSIYEIEGARQVAVEFRSFSKTAGFTGTRCAYTVVPKACIAYGSKGEKHFLHSLWNRRHSTKFNGVSYPVQKAAEAVYSDEGHVQVSSLVDYYLKNAGLIRKEMINLGYSCVGGINSPYIWIDGKTDSWAFFDLLLNKAGVVCTPGAGFGKCGEGFIRISAFNSFENVQLAMERIREALSE